jgi:chemotaxis protein CheD
MITKVLYINSVVATREPAYLTCYGLGSCIGLFIVDRTSGFSGGAHIPMPVSSLTGDFLDAGTMVADLISTLCTMGANPQTMRAKMTGGAQVYDSKINIGLANTEKVTQFLIDRKIFIAAKDCGGRLSRTARFNTVTSDLLISTSEKNTYLI